MGLASRIQELRKNAGLSQETLAEMLGISRQALGKWESGASLPTLENLTQLARIFHLSIDELITGQPVQSTEKDSLPLSAESIDSLLQRMEQTPKKRISPLLTAAAIIMAAVIIVLAIIFGMRLRALGKNVNVLSSRIDALASSPPDSSYTASLYQQILDQLKNEWTPSEPDAYYFDWELFNCDLQKKTMTIQLRATPRELTKNETISFLLSPTSGSSDTLAEAITLSATLANGQYTVKAEIPLCAQLDVYIQSTIPDGPTHQELAAQLYDLSTQFLPYFEADIYQFSWTAWNYSTLTFSGSPSISLTPARSTTAPKPIQIECILYYNNEAVFTKTLEVEKDFQSSDFPADEASLGHSTITYYLDMYDAMKGRRFDYISGAEIIWSFILADSAGNTYERTISVATLS